MAERSTDKPAAKLPTWITVAEASSPKQGWYKTTRNLDVKGGTLYQTTTEHRAPGTQGGGVTSCSEALVFVPGSSSKR